MAELLEVTPKLLLSSTYVRAIETARPFSDKTGCPIAPHPLLHEFSALDARLIEGMVTAQRRPMADAFWEQGDPNLRHGPGSETFREFSARVTEFAGEIPYLPPDTVFFGHGIWFALLCWKLLGFTATDATVMREFRRFQRALPMPNCAVYGLELATKGQWRLQPIEAAMQNESHLGHRHTCADPSLIAEPDVDVNKQEERASLGVRGMDEVLEGGLIRGRLYLLDGNPGAGKTTLALQYLLEGIRAGERCLYVTLSETREELSAGARSHGWNLDGIEVLELIANEEELDGQSEVTMYHPSEVELTKTTRQVLEAIERGRPDRMVLDSLSELRLLAQNSLRYRRQILALKQFFVGRSCTVMLLDDRTAEGPDLQLQSIAHGVISLDHRSPSYGRVRRQLQIVKFRGSDFRSGFHDFAIRKGGVEVFPRLTAAEHGIDFERTPIPSGVPTLDKLLGGGVDRGTSTLLVGPPGSGKSTVSIQYAAAAAARGDHAAIFAFDESRSILLSRSKGLGIDIKEGRGPGDIMIRQIDPAEIAPGEFAQLVLKSVHDDHARVVVIDSLNGYLHAMPDDRYLEAQLHELLSFLNNEGVATFLVVAQGGLAGGNRRATVDASYLADSVVTLRMYEHLGEVNNAISVVKKRSGSHERAIRRLWFDAEGIHLSEPLVQLRGVLTGVPVEVATTAPGPSAG